MLDILRTVSKLQSRHIVATPRVVATHLGVDHSAVRSPMFEATSSGLLEHVYVSTNLFGERDAYRLTFRGRQVAKELASA